MTRSFQKSFLLVSKHYLNWIKISNNLNAFRKILGLLFVNLKEFLYGLI